MAESLSLKSSTKSKKIKENSLFVDLVFNIPLTQSFTYQVPGNYNSKICVGQRVLAPFGQRTLIGYVLKVHIEKPSFKCKKILELYDEKPIFDDKVIELAKWVSEYYLSSLGEALSLFVPKETKEKPFSLNNVKLKPLLSLNKEQKNAVNIISKSIHDNEFYPYLLFGVTGSGKTEVYKYLSQEVVKKGKQALILVPEIALTPQTIERFQTTFGKRIAILHSKLNTKERYFNWKLIQNENVDIILGARSAIFSPINKLGIIIIDEEHESSYKSGDTPRYHARQVAFKICQTLKIPLVLGSATPSLESLYYSEQKRLIKLTLTERHSTYHEQLVTLVDMRNETSHSFISQTLFEKISNCLSKKEQVMIFLNKRGYTPLLICKDCGHTLKCPHCDISLTYHQRKKQMLCHYCHYCHSLYTICPQCKEKKISLIGYGTERVEEELKELFVTAKISRMDYDTTRKKGSHEKILSDFKEGNVDILIGTQMIAKGHHFPSVTLVGIVLADLTLHLPDFRATERTFSLLTQISGRTGRGEIKGEVVIQTYLPDHYVIQFAKNQDYYSFYLREIEERKQFAYPPFSRFIKLLIRGKKEERVIHRANDLYHFLKPYSNQLIEILGPAPAPLSKLNNNFRWQMILKGKKVETLQKLAQKAQDHFKKDNTLYLEIDVDPITMM